ncbi:MAG TPA: tyrosine--tRNA ligase [Candidatus Saccharimonadales bacterium]|jgi:tyrosyl-tRNA synthetase
MMKLSEELAWRGFVNQTTFDDIKKLDGQQWTFYHGFDASADSLTIGNLAGVMVDKVFMRHGCKAIILAGGATSLIGDPGGKDSERPMQDEETIARNVAGVAKQLEKVLAGYDFTLVNNLDWTKDMSVIAFLRDIGKHFSMTPLVQRDFIARRMGAGGAGISYTEFSYTLLQGMDFLHLFDNYGATLEVGSSDQWTNCISGIELIRRARNAEAQVFTHPLVVNKTTGKKFGKSEAGAVWLDPARTTPTQFYQFWITADDEGVEEYIKVYTELDKPAVDSIMEEHRKDPKKRYAQRRLAEAATKLIHGEQHAKAAEDVTMLLTGEVSLDKFSSIELMLDVLRKEIPAIGSSADGSIIDALVETGLAASNTEARRFLKENAVSVNGQKVQRETFEPDDFAGGRLLLRRGKAFKDSALVELG